MAYRIDKTVFAVASIVAVSASGMTEAATVALPGVGGTIDVPVASHERLRFTGVVKQQYDFSCGSAALATLLKHHYEYSTSEKAVFDAMYEVGDRERIEDKGFSLLDMKKYLQRIGYASDGFRLPLKKLEELGIPAITLVNTSGYLHFVVIKGFDRGTVLIGDPALGIRTVPRSRFEEMWNGVAFVIRDRADIARLHFNQPEEWELKVDAPMARGVDRSALGAFTLSLPKPNRF